MTIPHGTPAPPDLACQVCGRAPLVRTARGTYECCGTVWHADSDDWMLDSQGARALADYEQGVDADRRARARRRYFRRAHR